MPRIPFPNVPNLPGVPQLLRQLPAGPPPVLAAAAGIAQLIRSFASKPVWGIFKSYEPEASPAAVSDDGLEEVVVTAKVKRIPVVIPDSIRDFGYQKEWSVTTAPTQDGGFADYNRVANPFEVRLRMTKGGSEKSRIEFIKAIESLDTIQLYDIDTPEKSYNNCNFTRFEISREGGNGAYWLAAVDLYFREIRVVSSQYLNTSITQPKDVSASNVQNNGNVQAVTTASPVPDNTVSE